MKKVINGKLYNTDSAKEIHYYWNRLGDSDFRNMEETLYVTKSGNFFLYGEGGAMTKYARPVGDAHSRGEGIIPLNKEDALEWCEVNYVDSDIIVEYFSDLINEA